MAEYAGMNVRIFFATAVLCISLTGCVIEGDGTSVRLPPEQLLEEASRTVRELASVSFEGETDFDVGMKGGLSVVGNAEFSGSMTDFGRQVAMHAAVELTGSEATMSVDGTLDFDVVSDASEHVSYFKVNAIDVEPANALASFGMAEAMKGAWWKVSSSAQDDASVGQTIAPDPRLLHMQTQSLRILADLGDDSVDGFRCRKLSVTVDPEKFGAFLKESSASEEEIAEAQAMFDTTDIAGEIWIDSGNHSIRQLRWSFAKKPDAPGSGTYAFVVLLRLFDHNAVTPVVLPENAREFSAEAVMSYGNDSPGAHSQGFADFDSMTEEEQDLFIKTFIDGEINTSR